MEEKKEKRAKRPKSKVRVIIEWTITGFFVTIFVIVGIFLLDGEIHKGEHYNQSVKFGYSAFIVETDSMEPVYNKKNAVVTYLEDPEKIVERFNKGETVDLTFFDAYSAVTEYTVPLEHPQLTKRTSVVNYKITHRLQEVHINTSVEKGKGRYIFITAGINEKSTQMGWQEGQPPKTIDQYQAFTEKELLGRVVLGSAFLGGAFYFVSQPIGLLVLLLIPSFYLVVASVIDIFKAYKEPEPATESASNNTSTSTDVNSLSEEDKKRLKAELLEEMLGEKKGE